ncbi:MAG: chromosome partitioning protein ParA [Oscillospiraceae bacterium]|jgi:cellulose biosynthesis protein BcsQ|nr:chromosome partitioning protein ParA [Oscillospiraceae bacterium]
MRIRLAVLDSDRGYLDRLSAFFAARYADKLETYTFTERDAALECLPRSRINVFLAGETFDVRAEKLPKRCGFAHLTDSPDTGAADGRRTVFKYQAADMIYKAALELFDMSAGPVRGRGGEDARGVVLFTAASGGVGCSSCAAACATRFARAGRKTLYLNLEPLGDAGAFFAGAGQSDFSDIIFAIKSGAANLPLKLEIGARRDRSGVFFFAPPRTALDMRELDGDNMDSLMTQLETSGLYEYIIIDAAFSPGPLTASLLLHATSVVFVSDGSEMANGKLRRAHREIEIIESQSDRTRVPPVYIFYDKFSGKTGDFAQYDGARVIGGAPRWEGADTARIMEILSELDAFDVLADADGGASADAGRGTRGSGVNGYGF